MQRQTSQTSYDNYEPKKQKKQKRSTTPKDHSKDQAKQKNKNQGKILNERLEISQSSIPGAREQIPIKNTKKQINEVQFAEPIIQPSRIVQTVDQFTMTDKIDKEIVIRNRPQRNMIIDSPNQNVIIDPPNQNVITNRPNQNVITNPPNQNVITNQPNQNVITNLPNQNVITNPPNQNVNTNPAFSNDSKIPIGPLKQEVFEIDDEQQMKLKLIQRDKRISFLCGQQQIQTEKYEALKQTLTEKDAQIEELKANHQKLYKQYEERGDLICYKDKEIKELKEAAVGRFMLEDCHHVQKKLKETQDQLRVEILRSTNLQSTINDLMKSNGQHLSTITQLKQQYESRVHSPQRTEPLHGSQTLIHEKNEDELLKLKVKELQLENDILKSLNTKQSLQIDTLNQQLLSTKKSLAEANEKSATKQKDENLKKQLEDALKQIEKLKLEAQSKDVSFKQELEQQKFLRGLDNLKFSGSQDYLEQVLRSIQVKEPAITSSRNPYEFR